MSRCRLEREKTEQEKKAEKEKKKTMPEDIVQYAPLSASHTFLPPIHRLPYNLTIFRMYNFSMV